MNKLTRQILFYSFVAIFFMMSIVILTYAFGYTMSSSGFHLEKVGMFDIKTTPRGAKIYLNDQPQRPWLDKIWKKTDNIATSPAKLTNISPGEYKLRLDLDGYWPWEKKLRINPNETTYAENVRLFKKSSPQLLSSIDLDNQVDEAISPDKKHLAILSSSTITLVNLKDGLVKNYPLNKSISAGEISWAPDSSQFITAGYLINLAKDNSLDISGKLKGGSTYRFGQNSSEKIYYFANGQLMEYNIFDENIRQILNKFPANNMPLDWIVKDGKWFLLMQDNSSKKSSLHFGEISSNKESGFIELADVTDYQFINRDSKWLNLYDTKNHSLYLLEILMPFDNRYNLKKFEQVDYAEWHNNDELLLTGGSSIRIWQRDNNNENFLIRLSEPITFAGWHEDKNYIIYSTNNSLVSLELDNRDSHQENKLMTIDKIEYPALAPNGRTAYFLGQNGTQKGLFSLTLY